MRPTTKTYHMEIRVRTITWKSDGDPPPLRLELAHEPVPVPAARRGLLSWLRRPRIEHAPAPLQIPWWSSKADFVGAATPKRTGFNDS